MACAGLLRGPLYVANLLFMLAGAAVAGASGYGLRLLSAQAPAPLLPGAAAACLLAGAGAAAAALAGCRALHRRDPAAMETYSQMMVAMILLHAALGVALLALDVRIGDAFEKLVNGMDAQSLHSVERYFTCCGKTGIEMYRSASSKHLFNLPGSCCPPAVAPSLCGLHYYNSAPCNSAVHIAAFGFACDIAIGCIVAVICEVVLVCFGCTLADHFRKQNSPSTRNPRII